MPDTLKLRPDERAALCDRIKSIETELIELDDARGDRKERVVVQFGPVSGKKGYGVSASFVCATFLPLAVIVYWKGRLKSIRRTNPSDSNESGRSLVVGEPKASENPFVAFKSRRFSLILAPICLRVSGPVAVASAFKILHRICDSWAMLASRRKRNTAG
jgi:hypothetical protein